MKFLSRQATASDQQQQQQLLPDLDVFNLAKKKEEPEADNLPLFYR